ncbi:CdaR family protein [uncultured Lactobacillus sp.]|uniref:CdaR family protein n=1 Tax=uncultured Lactobacillus sp. TaxID=153152 RepID=UPI002666B08C|nr:CdaR family protein [uncultured Lactobacillus sp.]
MQKFYDKPWFYKLFSLILAIVLVAFVDNTQVNVNNQSKVQETASTKQAINMALQVSVDADKYYVTGYPSKVKVTLEGSNALVTSTVNTQNFRVYIDLSKLSVGKHKVPIKVSGLPSQLSYKLSQKYTTVNIQKRKSRTMAVQIGYNKNAVAKGYDIGTATVKPETVEVTGALSEVKRIDRIQAQLTVPNASSHTIRRNVMLVALDSKGRQLNVVINPSTATVTLPISVSKKTVKLKLNAANGSSKKVYSLTAKQDQVTIYGQKKALDKIKSLTLNVDLTNIKSSTTRSYRLPVPSGVAWVDPSSVDVRISVSDADD